MTRATHRVFALLATAVVVLSVVWGFGIAGSPESRRQCRLDERRIDALMDIQSEIQDLVRYPDADKGLRGALPTTLAALRTRANTPKLEITDPESGEPYGYRVLTETTYELSGTFTFERTERWRSFWNHPAGTRAFRVDVMDPPR